MSKKTCAAMFRLTNDRRWLLDYHEPLLELVYSCASREAQLLFELLGRFAYVDPVTLETHFDGMAEKIAGEWALPEERTQIVATTVTSEESDSAQAVLHLLRPRLRARGWTNPKMVNRIGPSVGLAGERPNIVLVDEFLGTGRTLTKRIRDHAEAYRARNSAASLRVCVLAAMEAGKAAVEAQHVEVHASLILRRGISDHYQGQALADASQRMLKLEAQLDPEAGQEPFHSFGYGGAEALYFSQGWNATNCLFPIFWWEYLRNNKRRTPMFHRGENPL